MTANHSKTPLQVLQEARQTIQNGWLQGRLCDSEERNYCTAAAISKANMNGTDSNTFLCLDLFRHANPGIVSVISWNDALERTKDEVLAAFDNAIKLLQSPEAPAIIEQLPSTSLLYE